MNPKTWTDERREAYRRSRALGLELLALPLVILIWIGVIVLGARIAAGMP